MTFEEYDALARKVTKTDFGNQIYGAHYHTWRSAVQLFGVLDGKHSILDGDYGFFADYYNMVLNQEKDGVCRKYSDLKTEGLHYSAAFSGGDAAMMNMVHGLSQHLFLIFRVANMIQVSAATGVL